MAKVSFLSFATFLKRINLDKDFGKEMQLKSYYNVGQFFIHKIFRYRGVIILPWTPRVFNRDILKKLQTDDAGSNQEKGTGQLKNYYQVLIDSRDVSSLLKEMTPITQVGGYKDSLFAIPGLDYVPHEDILPYEPTRQPHLQHQLFDELLKYQPEQTPLYVPGETLKALQAKNQPWLDFSEVHMESTEHIRVTLMPLYMGKCNISVMKWWRICIRVENLGNVDVTLLRRYIRIIGLSTTPKTLRANETFGKVPMRLSNAHPAFQYYFHAGLQCSSGRILGKFDLKRRDGREFTVKWPHCYLKSDKYDKKIDLDKNLTR